MKPRNSTEEGQKKTSGSFFFMFLLHFRLPKKDDSQNRDLKHKDKKTAKTIQGFFFQKSKCKKYFKPMICYVTGNCTEQSFQKIIREMNIMVFKM